MWLLFVLLCLVAVICQIIDRVEYYYDWPLNVNVKINYNQTLNFPAVTICNQNVFRATKTASLGRFNLVERLFSGQSDVTSEELHTFNASNISLGDLYIDSTHNADDLVMSCTWRNRPCLPSDFTMIMTDHGVCFQFYTNSSDMKVQSSGVDSGLRLTLNAEQYEYMSGPHDSAGIKILIHEPTQVPLVHALGQAVPTGTHAFIGMKYIKINNLEPPHGDCGRKTLDHTDNYSTEECFIDCLARLHMKTCGCRGLTVPSVDGEPSCTLYQYYTCIRDVNQKFEHQYRNECICPVSCFFELYEPSITYGSISNHLVKKILNTSDLTALKLNLQNANEVSSKWNEVSLKYFQSLAEKYIKTYVRLKSQITKFHEHLCDQHKKLDDIQTELWNQYRLKERIYRFQEYAVRQNFVRAYYAMEERTLNNAAHAFAEFSLKLKILIIRLANGTYLNEDSRTVLYNTIVDTIKTRMEIVEMARQNWTEVISAYMNGTSIFDYKFENLSRSENKYIVPKHLLNESLYYNEYMLEYVPEVLNDNNDNLILRLNTLLNIATEAYEKRSLNKTDFHKAYYLFHQACRQYMSGKSKVYSMGLMRPLRILQERRNAFEMNWTKLKQYFQITRQNSDVLTNFLHNISSNTFPPFEEIIDVLIQYTGHKQGTLTQISSLFASRKVLQSNILLKMFVMDVQTRGQRTDDIISMSFRPILNMWTMIVDDEDSIEYYKYKNLTNFQSNMVDVEIEWRYRLASIKTIDVHRLVTNNSDGFFKAFDTLTQHLLEFQESLSIDGAFIRENILQIDVFYRELNYEHIYQQAAYSGYALISDIGGAMGLFIGASILSVMEIIDLLLIQVPIFNEKSDKTRKSVEDITEETKV